MLAQHFSRKTELYGAIRGIRLTRYHRLKILSHGTTTHTDQLAETSTLVSARIMERSVLEALINEKKIQWTQRIASGVDALLQAFRYRDLLRFLSTVPFSLIRREE